MGGACAIDVSTEVCYRSRVRTRVKLQETTGGMYAGDLSVSYKQVSKVGPCTRKASLVSGARKPQHPTLSGMLLANLPPLKPERFAQTWA